MSTIISIITYLMMLAVNFLGANGRINQMSQKMVSDRYHTLITPAGFTFIIWSVIYLAMLISLLKLKREEKNIASFYPLFWTSCALNALWIFFYSYEKILLSTVIIFALLIVLTRIVSVLSEKNDKSSRFALLSFGFYTGWVFPASVINTANLLVQRGFYGGTLPESAWASVTLLVTLLLLILVGKKLQVSTFYWPTIWAMTGILFELSKVSGIQIPHPLACVCLILLFSAVYLGFRHAALPSLRHQH